jgi:hypothetical protein
MRYFWFHFCAFWHGFFHPFDSEEQKWEYAHKEAEKYIKHAKIVLFKRR